MKVVDYWHCNKIYGITFQDHEGSSYDKVLGEDNFSPEEIEILWPYCVEYKLVIPELGI